ncbi:MAG TPA: mucoidy inhibitor MuiA family protein [Roseiarcus sp.]|nr:mucoidy inhibitor MuiA family protein [Roseiarcus sp.]
MRFSLLLPLTAASSSLFVLGLALPALADPIAATSSIDAVTVYPDAAIVTRVSTVDLPAGDSVIVFKDLPLSLDPASLRVAGEGASKIAIGAVEAKIAPATAKAPDDAIAAKLTNLREERDRQRSLIEALQAKRAMIIHYSQADPSKGETRQLDVAQWSAAWDAVGEALSKLNEELRPLLARAHALNEEINALEAEQQRPAADAARREVSVALHADAAADARLTLSYRVENVGWRPAYDAALNPSNSGKSVALARRAILSQRSGEDWSNVALTVSTARVARSVDAPTVEPVKIDFWQPPVVFAAPAAAMKSTDAAKSAESPAAGAATAPKDLRQTAPTISASETTAETLASGFSAEFKVPGRISLPGDGAQKSFLLAREEIPATLLMRTAPGLDQTAYIAAHFAEDAQTPLLPGEVALYRDGAFVGQNRVTFVAPSDAVELGFGADDKVKVTRVAVNRKENEPTWYNQTKFEVREFKTAVQNLHAFPVQVQVIDQMPFSENTAIVAELTPTTTPPTERQVGDRRGVMSWTLDLQPGETKELHLTYRLKWPADRDVTIAGALVGPLAR